MSLPATHQAPAGRPARPLPPVGVLGGGQLGSMLADAAGRLGLDVTIAIDDPLAPAALGRHRLVVGPLGSSGTLAALARHARLVTWESENADLSHVPAAELAFGLGFAPGPAAMAVLQDKLRQKALLEELGIDSARYDGWDGRSPADGWLARVLETFGPRAVLKWARHGYDGRGVMVLRGAAADRAAALAFVRAAARRDVAVYAEAHVPFRRELSLVVTRTAHGTVAAYPLVISTQERGVCDRVIGPATAFGVPARFEAAACAIARRIGERLDLVGTYAVEFFEDRTDRLLVNEIAPRVHNTGHWTLDAGVTSQFENHWRALLGLRLGPTRPAGAFAMLNLLGPADVNEDATRLAPPTVSRGAHLHWYGKSRVRPGRKMGHVNLTAPDAETLRARLAEADRERQAWYRAISVPPVRAEAAA